MVKRRWCLTSTETTRLIRNGEKEGSVYGGGGRGRLYTCSCIKMVSDESHFNVSLIERDKVTRQCPQTTTFEEKRRPEAKSNRNPSAYQPNALTLGQTGSHKKLERMLFNMTKHSMRIFGVSPFSSYEITLKQQINGQK